MEPVTSLTGRDFNRDIGGAKSLADQGPVIVTDRGAPAYVLMTYETFRRLAGAGRSVADVLDDPAGYDIDFEPEAVSLGLRSADLG
ncbi:type II toxin-antitoxin system prevent-host-death family antitoxin [Rhodospirillum centenum]|uniref:Prevent-host-death family protein n=1 Tax=Rhodospirillum centenum (strain ATCC 51521 / SW) TaxID=414684 RepID=B6IVT6_RHOCS|nr:type II toxin-antitoxin system prevent-host-death family antitoxin [Rhodospirillum centenum]ACJ00410.1 prevent-host-death family protein [Rhodospirillum centenum SW]